jgi:hypothetical protein
VRWTGRFFLGDGWLVYTGPVGGATGAHAHHAFQLVRVIEGALVLQGADDGPVACTSAVIGPDVAHTTHGAATSVVLVYVDPDSACAPMTGAPPVSHSSA